MRAVNPLLNRIFRSLVAAAAAHENGDSGGVEAALDIAWRNSTALMDMVGVEMGTAIDEAALCLHSDIEMLDPRDGSEPIYNAIKQAVRVGVVANGPNSFARVPGWDERIDGSDVSETVRA
jgi:hypothetical protein